MVDDCPALDHVNTMLSYTPSRKMVPGDARKNPVEELDGAPALPDVPATISDVTVAKPHAKQPAALYKTSQPFNLYFSGIPLPATATATGGGVNGCLKFW